MLGYPSRISILRTICFAYMSGNNNSEFDKDGFMTACTQFGLNCPNPCVVRRLALYGNSDDVIKVVENLVKLNPNFNTDSYATMDEIRIPTPEPISRVEKVNKYKLNKVETRDMKETKLAGEGM